MIPNLTIDNFEHFFNEKTLKKGLSLFENGRVKNSNVLSDSESIFIIKAKKEIEVSVKKTGNQIIKRYCSCNKQNCEHVCAAIFYLAKGALNIKAEKKLKRSSTDRSAGEVLFNQSCKKLRALIDRHLKNNFASKNFSEVFSRFFAQNQKHPLVFTHLCIINEFSNILSFKETLSNKDSNNLLQISIRYLKKIRFENLTLLEREAWIAATINSLKNNKKFRSLSFIFLIPSVTKIISKKSELESLNNFLKKRYFKQNYKHYLDLKLIAQLQLQITESELLKSQKKLLLDLTPELSVAEAELKFCSRNIKSGFKILKRDYEKIKKAKPANFISYIEYIIEKANEFKEKDIEISFIKEILMYDHQIPPKYLKRINALLSKEESEKQLNEIIAELKKKSIEIYFDKVAQILESENRFEELIRLISKQGNKFLLLNRMAINNLPNYNDFLLKTYITQFINAVSEARETFHQKQILDKAVVYLNQLPKEISEKIILQVLDKISKSNFVYGLLKKYAENMEEE